jgi:NodT family efflux transporter outer membrane factor (OMF) lipoprotein
VQRDYQTSADASWEADIVGGIHSAIDASAATLDATSADLDNVVVTLAADVGMTYIRIRSLQERLTVAAANEAAQADSYDLTRFRQQAGLTTQLDVEQARVSLEGTRAQMASLRLDEAQAAHALAILLAEPPTSLDAELMDSRPVPTAPLSLAIGIPADVLRRRPDVRSAERRLAAQDAQVNVARASLYPRLTLTGSIGLETLNIAKWFVPGAAFWRLGPSLSLAAFDRTRIRQNIVIQDELRVQAAVDYESRVLTALSEVEDALVALGEESERRDRLVEAAAAAQQAADLALLMYSTGLRDFRDVLDAQRSLLSTQDSLASSRANLSTDLVRLYRSAGGGWSMTPTP